MEDDFLITMDDARQCGYCVKGIRHWGRLHGLDFKAFVREGIPASVVLATGDALGLAIVEQARERQDGRR